MNNIKRITERIAAQRDACLKAAETPGKGSTTAVLAAAIAYQVALDIIAAEQGQYHLTEAGRDALREARDE